MARQVWKWEPTARWIRTVVAGETIASSKQAMLMIESLGELDYYFPLADVREDFLRESDHIEKSGYRGTKRFWHLDVNGRWIENAAWTYDGKENRPDFSGYIAFKWKAMDHWYEEEEEVFLHPRNPYHRVDTIASSRHVEVFVDEIKVADSHRPYLLFETSLPVRYYLPREDVDGRFLVESDAQSVCPYKGLASYYHLQVDGARFENAVWYYPHPIPESPKLKDTIAFWPEKDKRIRLVVDGEEQ